MSRHQRRAIWWALIGLAILGVWWTQIYNSTPADGPQYVDVVVVTHGLAAGDRIGRGDLALRHVLYSGGLADALTNRSQLIGRRTAVAVPRGELLVAPEIAGTARVGRSVDVAIKLDPEAGVPAGDLAGTSVDLVLTTPGRQSVSRIVLAGVTVVATAHVANSTVATLRLPPQMVITAIRAESGGDLRLVAHVPGVPA